MGGYVIVSEIGSQITFIRDNLPIKKSDLLLKKPIPIIYMIEIWLEKPWLVDKSAYYSVIKIHLPLVEVTPLEISSPTSSPAALASSSLNCWSGWSRPPGPAI